ncbi:hypothetical protein WR25_20769 [Diploscapter pachys]|uniref:Nudix hydrolase domain-containing protein n=1 Tax=Diploscapter pachys TaxID=2018661 RepID=A0A2A2KDZ3_9BILA|nr:hypothetical protein WR25_20769 [Diploscapter pachys]
MTTVSVWKEAAAVILVSRQSKRILMLRRGSAASFMPNSLVFPGGVVSKADAKSAKLDDRIKICALRELFEEAGLFINSNGKIESANNNEELSRLQDIVKKDPAEFGKLNKSIGGDDFVVWNRWLTPNDSRHPKRFLATFFLLVIDGQPDVRLCDKEMSGFEWVDARSCLQSAFHGEISLPPPQLYELTRISQLPVGILSQMGNSQRVICPQTIVWSDNSHISNILPGDHLYIDGEQCADIQGRTMELASVKVREDLPTHRIQYRRDPLYSHYSIYQHRLQPPYDSLFQRIL